MEETIELGAKERKHNELYAISWACEIVGPFLREDGEMFVEMGNKDGNIRWLLIHIPRNLLDMAVRSIIEPPDDLDRWL